MKRITSEEARHYPPGIVVHRAGGYYVPENSETLAERSDITEQHAAASLLASTRVDELAASLADTTGTEIIRVAASLDTRKTAAPLYEARLQELTHADEE